MHNQKRPSIELGGPSSHSFLRSNAGTLQPSLQFTNIISKQATLSPHKISHKMSPNKCKIPIQKPSKQRFEQQNSINDLQMQRSNVTLISKLSGRTLLQERSNLISPKNKVVTLNYSTSVTPDQSRNNSFHQQEVLSPNKLIQSSSRTPYELQLQRKLKIVETRVSELHRQKQQIAAKFNEQNRKVYHENLYLKQKVNQLTKALQKIQTIENFAASQRSHGSSAQTYALQDSHIQITNLKKQIIQLEQCLTQKGSVMSQMIIQNQTLSKNLTKTTTINQNMEVEIKRLSDLLEKKQNQLEQTQTINADLQQKIKNYEQRNSSQETQIQNIRQLTLQNQERYNLILKEYQTKIEEYQNAYNNNQELIAHLQQQLQKYQNTAQSVIKEEPIQESTVHNELASQCQQLEDNLLTAIQQRDSIIKNLTAQNNELTFSLEQKEQQIQDILVEDKQKTQKLENASQLLQKFTLKCEQLEQKYRELTQKYEIEKSQVKAQFVPQKCRKCQQLLKTVLRLNTHLNPKRN